MNLLHRIGKLEAIRKRGRDARMRAMMDELDREIKALSDEELEAIIAQGEAEPCDPELKARLARMDDDELSRLILEGERA